MNTSELNLIPSKIASCVRRQFTSVFEQNNKRFTLTTRPLEVIRVMVFSATFVFGVTFSTSSIQAADTDSVFEELKEHAASYFEKAPVKVESELGKITKELSVDIKNIESALGTGAQMTEKVLSNKDCVRSNNENFNGVLVGIEDIASKYQEDGSITRNLNDLMVYIQGEVVHYSQDEVKEEFTIEQSDFILEGWNSKKSDVSKLLKDVKTMDKDLQSLFSDLEKQKTFGAAVCKLENMSRLVELYASAMESTKALIPRLKSLNSRLISPM